MASDVTLSTIHSFCHTLLKKDGRTFEILEGREQIRFIRNIMKKLGTTDLLSSAVLKEISLAKNNLITADEFGEMHEGNDIMEKIAMIYKAYDCEKHRKMLLDFNDLLIEAAKVLRENPEIRGKYHGTFRHIMVDEFQDTNPAQAEVLNLLKNNDTHTSFWVCGDDWQSIYGFAGASVGNIIGFQKNYPESYRFVLETNYRSSPQILKACENLIRHNKKKIDKRLITDRTDGEAVMILESLNEEEEALQIVGEIRDLVERKGYAYKDIAVLYRANSQSRAAEEAFSHHKIPYHIENGMNFYQRPEVRALLDYMRLIYNPYSEKGDEALRNIINIPNRYISRKFLAEIEDFAEIRNEHLYQALKVMPIEVSYLRKNIREFVQFTEPLMSQSSHDPSELIRMIREGLDYDRFVADSDMPSPDDSKIANISQLQMAAGRFGDIPAFLEHTEKFGEESQNDPEGVSLMTIHKSKGMEFPVVFVTGMIDGILPNKHGDIEEERRIAFVGLSRAMNLLYMSYSCNHMGKPSGKSVFIDEAMKISNV